MDIDCPGSLRGITAIAGIRSDDPAREAGAHAPSDLLRWLGPERLAETDWFARQYMLSEAEARGYATAAANC